MKTIWYVTEVHEYAHGIDTVVMKPVSWFKRNPKYSEADLDVDDRDWPDDAYIDAEPGEDGAEFTEIGAEIRIDQNQENPLGIGVHIAMEMSPVAYAVLP